MKFILLVDDEDSIRNTFAIFLQRAGYAVTSAAAIAPARKLLHEQAFDLVVSDIVLPDEHGLQLLNEIRQLGLNTPVILITGQPSVDNAAESLRQGAFDYLLKPVKKDDLLRVVAKGLEHKDLLDGKQLLQQENARYRLRLEELVHERTKQLSRANAQLRSEVEERQRAEQALRQNQDRLVLALDISGAAAFESRPQEGEFICSERLAEITGVPRDELARFHDNYKNWLQRFHPDDRQRFHKAFTDLNEGRVDFVDEVLQLQRADGEWRHLHGLAKAAEHSPHGYASRIVGVILDISPQVRSKELLMQQRDLGLALSTATSQEEAALLTSKTLEKLDTFEIFGFYTLNQQSQELTLLHSRGLSEEALFSLRRYDSSSSQYKYLVTGEPLYTSFDAMDGLQEPSLACEGLKAVVEIPLMHENRLTGALCLASRTTEYIPSETRYLLEALAAQMASALAGLQAQEALRASEAKYRNLIDTIPHGILELGLNGEILFCNQVTASRYDRAPEDLLGIQVVELMATPEQRRNFQEALQKILDGTAEQAPFAVQVRNAQGELAELQADWNWNYDDKEQLKSITTVVTDVTARNRAERALQQAQERLEQRVQERTRELRETSQQLRRLAARQAELLEEERKRIAREIHDELGQSLTALNMGLSVLGNMLPAEDAHLQNRISLLRTPLEQMIKSVQRICQELRPMQLDDLGLTAAIAWRIRDFEKSTGVTTQLHTEDDDITVSSELGTAIYRLIQEALTNAARHAGPERIDVRLQRKNKNLVVTVTDNGQGIDPEVVHSKNSFGLIGMRERMRSVGGCLEINGATGKGTTIRAIFPLEPDTLEPDTAAMAQNHLDHLDHPNEDPAALDTAASCKKGTLPPDA